MRWIYDFVAITLLMTVAVTFLFYDFYADSWWVIVPAAVIGASVGVWLTDVLHRFTPDEITLEEVEPPCKFQAHDRAGILIEDLELTGYAGPTLNLPPDTPYTVEQTPDGQTRIHVPLLQVGERIEIPIAVVEHEQQDIPIHLYIEEDSNDTVYQESSESL